MTEDFETDLEDLVSAEDFLDYCSIAYDPSVVHVNRLHILQRFHDYLAQAAPLPEDEAERYRLHHDLLAAAYQDFVTSDARTEKVFRVFHIHEPKSVSISVEDLLGTAPVAASHAP
ncbi:MAG: nitrogen fixation protein NifW [Gammaproteobacteria bacterium]|nr:nitrogen fixation protein NifW [Gammaproteobacteria bacterium]